MVEIDGSMGEGGGQVLRTALALSALTGLPTRVHRIRAGRRSPGLAPQHLTAVLALQTICAADVRGAKLGSTEVVFRPGSPPRPDTYRFDVGRVSKGGSAGSVTLLFQALMLPLAFATAKSRVTLVGGTHVAWSPPYHYLEHVFLPTVARLGLRATSALESWGFYPVGGGRISTEIEAVGAVVMQGSPDTSGSSSLESGGAFALTPLDLTSRGDLQRLWGLAVACNLPAHISQRMANRARNLLKDAGIRAEITPLRVRGSGPGAGLFLIAEYARARAGFSALGAKGVPSEAVAEEAFQTLIEHHNRDAPVDPHLADQLLLPLSLAEGRSTFRTSKLTGHLFTNAEVIRAFLPVAIEIEGLEGQPGEVAVGGNSR